MKHSSLALLGLCLAPSFILADKSNGKAPEHSATPPTPQDDDRPLTLLEKNKLQKASKNGGLKSGLEVRVVGGDQVTQESKYPFFFFF